MACNHKPDSACPFSFTDRSEQVQNWGCLPEPYEIVTMRVKHGKTWACHEDRAQPCLGAIRFLKLNGLPYSVVDHELVTEESDWARYLSE